MIFIGLLTQQQKQAGYFVGQDNDFIYLYHRNDGNPRCVAVFNYEIARVKEIRDEAEQDGYVRNITQGKTQPHSGTAYR